MAQRGPFLFEKNYTSKKENSCTVEKENYWILRIVVVSSCQKLDIILENKVIQKLMLSIKFQKQKNALLNLHSSMKKDLESFGWFGGHWDILWFFL